MARIKYTAIVDNIRGSIGGTTFQRNAYGYTIKSKPNMVNPNTSKQIRQKALFSGVVSEWSKLSAATRTAWENYANAYPEPSRLNPASNIDGYAMFVKWANNRTLYGANFVNTLAVAPLTVILSVNDISFSAGIAEVDINEAGGSGVSLSYTVFMSRNLKATESFNKNKLRYIAQVAGVAGAAVVITAAYLAVFGVQIAVGQRIAIQVKANTATTGKVYESVPEIRTVVP
jgi:hypothetical protein